MEGSQEGGECMKGKERVCMVVSVHEAHGGGGRCVCIRK